jgi:hypothetical protein
MTATRRLFGLLAVLVVLLLTFGGGWLAGRTGMGMAVDPASLSDLERQFVERMRNATLVGSFTVTARPDRPLSPDRYEIAGVEKVGDDLWRFNARLVHEGMDVTLPIVVPMRWLGDTPVIMMTNYSIPTLGTFDCRLFFYKDHYAGTWGHGDEVAGHLFGRIERK